MRRKRPLLTVIAVAFLVLIPACRIETPNFMWETPEGRTKIESEKTGTNSDSKVVPPLTPKALPTSMISDLQALFGDDYILTHWMKTETETENETENGHYLVEMTCVPTGEHSYAWVTCDDDTGGWKAETFGMTERPFFTGVDKGTYRFLCDVVGDSIKVFPYYLSGEFGEKPKITSFYKRPNAETYLASTSGLAYKLWRTKVTTGDANDAGDAGTASDAIQSLDLLFTLTGPSPGEIMAGGARPPAARITEDGRRVTFRFWHVDLGLDAANSLAEAMTAFFPEYADPVSWSCKNGCLELVFSVPWTYSITVVHEDAPSISKARDVAKTKNPTQKDEAGDPHASLGYRISFLPTPKQPISETLSFHDLLAVSNGICFGDTKVIAPRLFGEIQQLLLRAFPIQNPVKDRSMDQMKITLHVNGNWLAEKGEYYRGTRDTSPCLRWGKQWYEIDPALEILIAAANLPVYDSLNAIPVLMYHQVDTPAGGLTVTPEDFRHQMDFITASGYETVSMDTLLLAASGEPTNLPQNPLVLAFDDGYDCFYRNVHPILKERGLSATIFLITGKVGNPGYLNWKQIEELAREDYTIGCHTHGHPDLRMVSIDGLDAEVIHSREILMEKTGQKVLSFCYPAGAYDEEVVQAVEHAGFLGAVTTEPGFADLTQNLFTLRRIRIDGRDSLATFKWRLSLP